MSIELSDKQDYPWRESLTNKARCACCSRYSVIAGCLDDRKLVYPLYAQTHDCSGFKFKPADPIRPTVFNQCERAECSTCGHNLDNVCSGKEWFPPKLKDGLCEFWRDRALTCRFAVPYHQYVGGYRNNYCRLEPEKRDGDASQGWRWNCSAHMPFVCKLKCYQPIGSARDETADH